RSHRADPADPQQPEVPPSTRWRFVMTFAPLMKRVRPCDVAFTGLILFTIVLLAIGSMAGCGTTKWKTPAASIDGVGVKSGISVDGERWGAITNTDSTWQQIEFDEANNPIIDTISPVAGAVVHADLKSGKVFYQSTGDVDLT